MKIARLKIVLTITIAAITTVFFNGSSFFAWRTTSTSSSLTRINEASRVAHAKELLGRDYGGSSAQILEGQKSLHKTLQAKVRNSLPPKWKAQAQSITETVITESAKYHLDPVFVLAVIKTESKFNPLAKGRFGEIGLMQIKPSTAEWIAHKNKITWKGKKTLENPSANIRIALAYMDYLRTKFHRKALKYVSAYNMGPSNVQRLLSKNLKPAEYNARVMKNYHDIYAIITGTEKTKRALVAAN